MLCLILWQKITEDDFKMKRVVAILMAIALVFCFNMGAYAEDTISVTLDGNYVGFDVEPQVIDGRIMVPIRAIFEAMGAQVYWDNGTGTAVCTKGNTVVKMTLGSREMYIGNEMTLMDVSPAVVGGRTLAPARYVAEAFDANVNWNQDTNTVVISTYPAEETYTLYALDGRTISVPKSQVQAYLNVGWYDNYEATRQTLYALDGRTVTVYKAEVPAYVQVGWYENFGDTQQTLYAPDGRTVTVYKAEVPAYVQVGWFENIGDTQQTLYALDGRTITVYKSEVPSYLSVGWYATYEETLQTLYAADGRTITVYKADVPAYKQQGWYASSYEANAAARASYSSSSSSSSSSGYNPGVDGYYYRTPSGKKYHLDPNCGGKNSYRTSNISELSPCSKCAQ